MNLPLRIQPVAEHAPRGDASRFTDVLYSCVGHVGKGDAGIHPACDTLHRVEEADVEAFRHEQPHASDELEKHLAAALRQLEKPESYRAVGLYLALLTQNIDLARSSTGQLGEGKAAETAAKLSAIVRQSLQVRDERNKKQLPDWGVIVIAVLGGLLALLVIGFVVYASLTLRKKE